MQRQGPWITFSLVLALVAMALSGCGVQPVTALGVSQNPAASAGAEPIALGFVGVLSGPVAMNGELSSRGAILAVEEINAAGGVQVGGTAHPFKLVLEDDQGKPEPSINAVTKLIEQDKVFAIFGPEFANAVLAILPIVQERQVPLFYSTNSPAVIRDEVRSDYAFRIRVEDTDLAAAVAAYIVDELGDQAQVAISHNSSEYGKTGAELVEAALTAADVPVVAVASHNFGDQDLTPNASAVLSGDANVVVTWSGPAESILLLRTLRNLGWTGTYIHGNTDSIFATIGQDEVEGLIGPQGWAPTDPGEQSQAFVAAYEARFGQTPDNHAAAYYDGVYLLKSALEAVSALDGPAVRDYLMDLDAWQGVQGTFHPADFGNGNMLSATVLVQIEDGQLQIIKRVSD